MEQIRQDLHVLHTYGDDRTPESGIEFEGIEVRRLREWLDRCLRWEDSHEGRELLKIVNEVTQQQGYEKGRQDALAGVSHQMTRARISPFKESYDIGYAEAMSAKAGEE